VPKYNVPALSKHTLKSAQNSINLNLMVNTHILGHERLNYLNMKVGTFGWVCRTRLNYLNNVPALSKHTLMSAQKSINLNLLVNTHILGHERLNYLNMWVGMSDSKNKR